MYNAALGSKKYPVELAVDEGPTVGDLANLAAELAEVPRGSQRLIFKGTSCYMACASPLKDFKHGKSVENCCACKSPGRGGREVPLFISK